MVRGVRTSSKHSNNQHVRMKRMDSEDSDDDYVAEADEIDEQSDDLDSLVGDASEEESFFEVEEEEWRTVVKPRAKKGSVRSRNNGIKRPKKRRKIACDDDDEGDEDFTPEEEWRTVVKPRAQKGSVRSRKNGIKRPKKRRKVECEDDEDFDDNNEEFTPDEIESLEEEEEFPLPKRKMTKRGRTTLKRKSYVRNQRRKTSEKAPRKRLKKRSKEDFTEKGPTTRGKAKKKSKHRKKRGNVGSDSGFCSDSSDYEFTISEEEREQVREANELCRSLTTSLRSSRRIQEDEALCEPRKPVIRKGKEKAEETKNDVGKPVCGICLTEEGKNSIRGTLNCCTHYFCFACIMEWSKVESRCPLCKQRFVTISKPARCVKGFDLRNSVIQIPERDQAYQPSEEELRDFLNPYENVICSECHLGGDDALMLLCDLCDSPAHTYCVGLGREVPEGNWYCDGCRPASLGSSHSQAQDLTPDQRTNADASHAVSAPYENMAEIDLNVTIPETPVSQANVFLSSPRYSGGSFQASSPVSGMGVSTVSGRRWIHRQIQVLLSNRLSQMGPVAGLDSLRSILGVGVSSTFQQSRTTDVGTSHHTQLVDRLQETPHNVQNRDAFPGSPDHMVGHRGQASTSTGSDNGHIRCGGLDRMNLGASQTRISSSEQLRPCTSRLSFGLDMGASPSHNQDEDHTSIVKQQVHSIVNSQLKSLSKDLDLSHDDYAIICRRATDTIVVAYEREPPRRDIHQVLRPYCPHVDRSTYSPYHVDISPMNECCLACFENFAKDVVKRMMNITSGPTDWWRFRY